MADTTEPEPAPEVKAEDTTTAEPTTKTTEETAEKVEDGPPFDPLEDPGSRLSFRQVEEIWDDDAWAYKYYDFIPVERKKLEWNLTEEKYVSRFIGNILEASNTAMPKILLSACV
jgi:hypothetical protein